MITSLLAVLTFFTLGGNLHAQLYQILLKIDTVGGGSVKGSSTQPGHIGEIDVVSYKAGLTQRALMNLAGGGATAATSDFKPLTIFKRIDLATPVLLVNCALGKPFPSATLTINKIENDLPQPFFKIVLMGVVIASVNEDSDATDQAGVLVETAALSYRQILWTFTPRNSDGTLGTPQTAGFDIIANKPIQTVGGTGN